MISLDYSILYQVILFLILWLLLDRLLFRPYLALLERRERQTLGVREETRALIHEGERLKAQYEEATAQAEARGGAAKDVILAEARRQCESILNLAREHANRALAERRQEIQSQMQQAQRLAQAEAATIAQEMVRKILGRPVS